VKSGRKALLEANGWAVGDARTFLGLSDEEQALIDSKLALDGGSSNPALVCVAKMEADRPGGVPLLCRGECADFDLDP
jgi:hypothetical protein